jgi:signal transduction histidine kinase
MFLAWGPELRFIYNDGYSEILGSKHPAALGHAFEDIWAEIWGEVSPIAVRAIAGEASFYENLPLTLARRGFPEQTFFTFSYSPVRDESGGVGGMLCTCVETTSTVVGQRERMGEVERLRKLFDHAPGFMTVLRGPDHVFEMMNASYLQLVGHRDLVGKPVREALPEVEGQGFFELLDDVYRSREAFTGRSVPSTFSASRALRSRAAGRLRLRADRRCGHRRLGHLRRRLRRDRAPPRRGEIARKRGALPADRGFGAGADVGDPPRPHQELRQPRLCRVPRHHLQAGHHLRLAHRHPPRRRAAILAESIAGEASLETFELVGRYRSGGDWRWIRSVSQPRRGPGGEHIGFIGVAHDITGLMHAEAALREVNETLERRVAERTQDLSAALDRLQAEVGERLKAEEALRQAQKMEAVGQLTGGIAHDFNNLLTPIMGGLELIASKVEDPRLKRLAQSALESSRRGAKLTGQLLAFSRIQRLVMAPVAVNEVIADMQTLLRHTIGGEVAIDTALDRGAGFALCDANQLENAVLNLAINARDAMPDGGTLTISTRRLSLDEEADHPAGDFVRLRVEDDGEGMSAEVLARATEPFYSTKPIGKGTGLGLAQVYGIVRQSGGTLRIDSEIDKGTRVDILLPGALATEAAAPAALRVRGGPAAPAAAARILVVDDDPDVRTFLVDPRKARPRGVAALQRRGRRWRLLARTPDLA